jgi:hypothetical protein
MKFKIQKLRDLLFSIEILRTCPAIPFQLANSLNANWAPISSAIKEFDAELALLQERNTEIQKIVDEEEKRKLIEELNKDFVFLTSKDFVVELKPVLATEFEECEIVGEKEVTQSDQTVKKFLYRDSYFVLSGDIIK